MASLKRRIEELELRQLPPRASHSVQFDEDAVQLYDMAFELHGQVHPDWRTIREAPIGIRGEELQRQKYGPIIPVHECPGWSQWTHSSSEFRHCFNREPVEGDLLRWEHVRAMRGPEINEIKFGDQIEAWQRQLPHLPCPLKFEEGRLFKRQRNGDWFEAVDVSWRARWWGVECDARGAPGDWAYGTCPELWSDPDPNPLARMASILAVTFLGVIDGKNACRPATDDELRRPEPDEFFRVSADAPVQKNRPISSMTYLSSGP